MPDLSSTPPALFTRCNLADVPTQPARAHGGEGEIAFARILDGNRCQGALNFIDLAILEPGVSIGRHRHGPDEEEYYLVLEGEGEMWREGERFAVGPGELIRNPPGGAHGLVCTGDGPLRLFVFEVRAP